MQSLQVHYPSRRSFLSCTRSGGDTLSLCIDTDAQLLRGDFVRLEISVGGIDRVVSLTGRVRSVMGDRVDVAVEGNCKREAAQLVALCAGRPLAQGTAASKRHPSDIRCMVRVGTRRIRGRVADLSTGGVFVATERVQKLPVGTEVTVQFEPGLLGFGGRRVVARVVWRGRKKGIPGVGVRFVEDGPQVQAVVRRYLVP